MRRNNFWERIFVVTIIVMVVALVWTKLPTKNGKRVRLKQTIKWLEESNPSNHEEVKAKLGEFVQERTDRTPEKVAFFMQWPSGFGEYQLDVYYRYHSKWYCIHKSWASMGDYPELDKMLQEISPWR